MGGDFDADQTGSGGDAGEAGRGVAAGDDPGQVGAMPERVAAPQRGIAGVGREVWAFDDVRGREPGHRGDAGVDQRDADAAAVGGIGGADRLTHEAHPDAGVGVGTVGLAERERAIGDDGAHARRGAQRGDPLRGQRDRERADQRDAVADFAAGGADRELGGRAGFLHHHDAGRGGLRRCGRGGGADRDEADHERDSRRTSEGVAQLKSPSVSPVVLAGLRQVRRADRAF